MSSALVNILPESPARTGQQRLLTPKTLPIPLLASDLARYYSYAYTVQLLLYYYFRSGYLVSNPLQTLLEDIVPLAISQGLFCAVCLPRAGTWVSGTSDGEIIQGSSATTGKRNVSSSTASTTKKRPGAGTSRATTNSTRDVGGSVQDRILATVLALLLSLLLPPVPLMVLALALGAPLYPTSLLPHTLALSVHVSLLVTLPIFYTHGVSSLAWKEVSAVWLPFDEAGVWAGSVGAVVGAWIGAIPMALDWDREWQKWPCTVLWGAVMGWAVGRTITNAFRFGTGCRIDLSVRETMIPPDEDAFKSEKKD